MFYKEEDLDLMVVENFSDNNTWLNFIKMEIDELLSVIKKITRLRIVNYGKKLQEITKCLAKTRNEILDISGCFKLKLNDTATAIATNNGESDLDEQ